MRKSLGKFRSRKGESEGTETKVERFRSRIQSERTNENRRTRSRATPGDRKSDVPGRRVVQSERGISTSFRKRPTPPVRGRTWTRKTGTTEGIARVKVSFRSRVARYERFARTVARRAREKGSARCAFSRLFGGTTSVDDAANRLRKRAKATVAASQIYE